MDQKTQNDLFDNPMVNAAKKALTPEQLDEYKRIGEYMYNNVDYKNAVVGSQVRESKDEDLILYATEALKSGGDPKDLTEAELQAFCKIYGDNWYERFGFEESEVPKPVTLLTTAQQVFAEAEKKSKELNLSRQQRRAMERRMQKDREKIEKSHK